jgi:uncharacterized protein YacL (UPF0231 family)
MAGESANINDAEVKDNAHIDHKKLARYYEKEAREMNAKAEEQKTILDEYENQSQYYGREGQLFQSHHQALLREYEKAAEQNLEMAATHRKMAEKTK